MLFIPGSLFFYSYKLFLVLCYHLPPFFKNVSGFWMDCLTCAEETRGSHFWKRKEFLLLMCPCSLQIAKRRDAL
ncbi:hypothetical protein AB434_0534 [Heyndrickxia coagulans]|nr:hypothetical protein AB434_0534 [Heyndrickxia coagulans]